MIGSRHEQLLAQTTQAWAPPDVTDLGIGQPDDAILPVELLASAATAHLARGLRHPLQYGTEWGDGHLRLALGEFLGRHYGCAVDPEPMLITNGSSQALDLACGVLGEPGDVILVEDPTYHLALEIFRDHRLRLVGVPMDGDGLSIEALEQVLRHHRPRLLYTVPTFHNPTGATLASSRRRRLVELAREHGFLILADEVYHLLRYRPEIRSDADRGGPEPMAAHVGSGVVLSLGTFSKILAPGLRLGWIQGPEQVLARLAARGYVVSGGGLNPYTAAMVAEAVAGGMLDEYLGWLRPLLAGRARAMEAGLRAHFPAEVTWPELHGGYFFWLAFPPGTDTARFVPEAQARKVGFRPGNLFSLSGSGAERMRLSFAYYPEAAIDPALARLGEAIRATGTSSG